MFYSRMTTHKIQEPQSIDDGLGFEKQDYSEQRDFLAYITSTSMQDYNQNDLNLTRFDYVCHTQEKLTKGSLIDGTMRVESCLPARDGYTSYLLGVS